MFCQIIRGNIPALCLLLTVAMAGAQSPAGPPSLKPRAPSAAEPRAKIVSQQPRSGFREVARERGLIFSHAASPTPQKYLVETMGGGVALFDFNNDGRLDVFFANGATISNPMPAGQLPIKVSPADFDRLFQQQPGGTFVDVTDKAGVSGKGKHYSMGVAAADFDNDGFTDLYVTAFGSNTLYRNRGDGTFSDVTATAGVAGGGWSSSAAWVDADADGLLDLFVVRYLDWTFETNNYCGERGRNLRAYCHPDLYKGVAALLYRNLGGGRFAEAAQPFGVANAGGKSLGIAIADYDLDGKIDVFVANDSVRQFLYHNQGGRFVESALPAGVAVDGDGNVYAGMGVDFADYNNDLLPDVVVTNLSNQRYALYRNEGGGEFAYATGATGLGRITLLNAGWGVRFLDFDNDGWKDLLVAQSHVLDTVEATTPHVSYRQPPLLLRNLEGRQFADAAAMAGPFFKQKLAARGLAIGDIDNDGDVDAVMTTTNGPAYLLLNQWGSRGNWLSLRLRGRKSNRDAIGATVTVTTPDGMRQSATVTTSSSYQSSSDQRVHFGLGRERRAEITIAWPSGARQVLKNVSANQHLNVEEEASASPSAASPASSEAASPPPPEQ